jgi:hypothetical protein
VWIYSYYKFYLFDVYKLNDFQKNKLELEEFLYICASHIYSTNTHFDTLESMKYLIIGGVAGGVTTAARLRRLDEKSEIIVFERGEYISYANCGLPYYIGVSSKTGINCLYRLRNLLANDLIWKSEIYPKCFPSTDTRKKFW